MVAAIQKRQASNKAKDSGVGSGDAEGHSLVGFGPYRHMTRQALYLSMSDEHKNYIRDLIRHPVTHPGGQLDQLKKYLLKKMEEERQDDDALAQMANEMEQTIHTGANLIT